MRRIPRFGRSRLLVGSLRLLKVYVVRATRSHESKLRQVVFPIADWANLVAAWRFLEHEVAAATAQVSSPVPLSYVSRLTDPSFTCLEPHATL